VHALSCWITKATDTLRIRNTYCFSTATVVSRPRPNVMFICTLPALFYYGSDFSYVMLTEWYVWMAAGICTTYVAGSVCKSQPRNWLTWAMFFLRCLVCGSVESAVRWKHETLPPLSHFCFDSRFYEKTYWVAMSWPLLPVVASFFMEDFEEGALSGASYIYRSYFRCVDDMFVISHTEQKNWRSSWAAWTADTAISSSPWR
jgi:hypothetical protein